MNELHVMKLMIRIRTVFEEHFENRWFYFLFEDVPFDPLVMRDIRNFLRIDHHWQITSSRVYKGIEDLELFVLTVKKYLLPCLKERLHISYLRPDTLVRDPDQLAIRRLVATVIPANVAQLDQYTRELKAYVRDPNGDRVGVAGEAS